MKRTYINISAAIRHHNSKCRECDKLTQEKLAKIVFPEVNPSAGRIYLSQWNNGVFKDRKVKAKDLKVISRITGFPLKRMETVY